MPKKPQRSYAAKSGAGYDKCWTPPQAVPPLNTYLTPGSRIWEMCAGEGWLARWLRELGHTVIETEYEQGFDSLVESIDHDLYDVIVTNPPWSNKYAFLERCTHLYQALGKPWALLVPDSTVSAGRAARIYAEQPWEELRLKQRINFYMPDTGYDNNGAQVTAWWLTCGLLPRSPIYADVPEAPEGHRIIRKTNRPPRPVHGTGLFHQFDIFSLEEEENV